MKRRPAPPPSFVPASTCSKYYYDGSINSPVPIDLMRVQSSELMVERRLAYCLASATDVTCS